jgi:hypothetical protein
MEENVWTSEDERIAQIEEKLRDLEAQIGASNPRNLAGIKSKELRAATRANSFGDGSDGVIIMDGVLPHTEFSSLSINVYTLTRDLFAQTLTVNLNITLNPNGFRIFTSGDLIINGEIAANGNVGGTGATSTSSATGAVGGIAGAAAHSSGSLVGSLPGVAGGDGGGRATNGAGGTAGTNVAKSLGAAGSGGGGGGSSSTHSGGGGGNGGSKTGTVYNVPRSQQGAYNLFDTQPSSTLAVLNGSAVGGGGGGGGGATGGNGAGGGGGSGSPGGFIVIFSYRIINNGFISADGGAGGNGGNGTALPSEPNGSGAGGGGAGGAGGVIILVYGIKTGSGTTIANGGAGGTGGTGGVGSSTTGNNGANGSIGLPGSIIEISVG